VPPRQGQKRFSDIRHLPVLGSVLPYSDIPIHFAILAFVNQGFPGLKVVGSHLNFHLIPAETGEGRGLQVFGLGFRHIHLL
jgi:hypothetical protein